MPSLNQAKIYNSGRSHASRIKCKFRGIRCHVLPCEWAGHADAANDSSQQAPNQEWSQAPADFGTDLLFGGEPGQGEEIEEEVDLAGAGRLTLRSISRLHRHTLAHTGLMLWESAPALCRFLACHSKLLCGE